MEIVKWFCQGVEQVNIQVFPTSRYYQSVQPQRQLGIFPGNVINLGKNLKIKKKLSDAMPLVTTPIFKILEKNYLDTSMFFYCPRFILFNYNFTGCFLRQILFLKWFLEHIGFFSSRSCVINVDASECVFFNIHCVFVYYLLSKSMFLGAFCL